MPETEGTKDRQKNMDQKLLNMYVRCRAVVCLKTLLLRMCRDPRKDCILLVKIVSLSFVSDDIRPVSLMLKVLVPL
jgi:hypothetical protein